MGVENIPVSAYNRRMLPRGLETKKGRLSFCAIHQRYSATTGGKTLLKSIRFGLYKPGNMTNEEWCAHLGPDANNLHHLYTTYLLTREYLALHPSVTFDEKRLLLLAAITHDWGEAVTGDILLPLKTREHTVREKEILRSMLMQELRWSIDQATADMIPVIVFEKGRTLLGAHFDAIEKWGYLRTALRAWRTAHSIRDRELLKNVSSLVHSVFAFHFRHVLDAAGQSRVIHNHLTGKAHMIISHVCDTMPQDMHEHHVDPSQKDWVRTAFKDARAGWKKFIASRS